MMFNRPKAEGHRKKTANLVFFTISFAALFAIYHIPGYLTYHKLMLEDKGHTYVNGERIKTPDSWAEKNAYFELYNVHKKPNKWGITAGEVDSFKQQHPEITLNISYTDYVKKHTAVWVRNLADKLFFYLPYGINHCFFFAKWTLINKVVKSYMVMHIIGLVIIILIFVREYKFIGENAATFLPPLLFYCCISLYTIPQLEGNWLIYCFPFFSLPVARFLVRYVNIILLLALQFLFMIF